MVKEENRFTDEYTEKEVEWYGLKEYEHNGVKVQSHSIRGRVDEYFNKRFWVGEFEVPILTIDSKVWMSITPMEVQSMILPIQFAAGKVGTGGLGMGYFALKCAENDDVEEIRVWETNPDIIKFFNDSFSHREGFHKIEVIHGDAREIKNQQFDFFFMDIYRTQLSDKTLEDYYSFFQRNGNDAETYHFWYQEWPLLQALFDDLDPYVSIYESMFFGEFFDCPYPGDGASKKVDLYKPLQDDNFIESFLSDTGRQK